MKSVAFLAEDGLRCGAAGVDVVEPTSHAGEKKLSKMARDFKVGRLLRETFHVGN